MGVAETGVVTSAALGKSRHSSVPAVSGYVRKTVVRWFSPSICQLLTANVAK